MSMELSIISDLPHALLVVQLPPLVVPQIGLIVIIIQRVVCIGLILVFGDSLIFKFLFFDESLDGLAGEPLNQSIEELLFLHIELTSVRKHGLE